MGTSRSILKVLSTAIISNKRQVKIKKFYHLQKRHQYGIYKYLLTAGLCYTGLNFSKFKNLQPTPLN